jgi:hypothetical protein
MIVSHAHKFIYIKTYKTASTSMEAALSEVCGPDDVITPASEPLMKFRKDGLAQNYRLDHPLVPKRPLLRRLLRRPERRYHPSVGFYEHMPAWRVKAYLGDEIWHRYYKFTFERNPWDRQVSWYQYKTKSKARPPGFDSFLRDKGRAWVENYDLYSIDDALCVDFVGRYENLEQDFAKAMQAIGLKGKAKLPLANISADHGKRDYQRYYTSQTRDLMGEWYAREIAAFGYEF